MATIKYWAQIFLLPIYWFSFIIPKNKKIWVCGSSFGKRFADNPKYLYLYLNQYQKSNIRTIWISSEPKIIQFLKENGYEAYLNGSFKGIFYCLRAKVYIFDNYSKDISFWLSGGAIKINLWHGVGNKKINYDNKFDAVRHPKNIWEKFKTYLRRLSDEKPSHYILATSPIMGDIFAGAFQVPRNHIIEAGYPRNDMLVSQEIQNLYTEQEKKCVQQLKKFKDMGKTILFYMPTFRDSETQFFEVMDLERWNNFLERNHFVFCPKLHPKSKLQEKFNNINTGKNKSNIFLIPAQIDSYGVLQYADLLITDYSSIYSDFLMLNRPSVLFPYDYETYLTDTREEYFSYDEYMPEPKAKNMEELMEYIKRVCGQDTYQSEREKVRTWMFTYTDGKSSERIYEKIQELL
ncbi:CDP-glycerol glycerophosphotransferase family protein [Anaerosacchariphilus polymeriproducens]|uniref:Uncharacterized protein n=1 Tax=Anaerosacchariphilus polymeriproducens TaxID=1812858 RepID=A0A371AQK9_9FIRM|nr:CDP-glycerol glycerophosphotransferase family protein [Anaerosacchariphilus polymeriproducens]RDU21866.1 hypothetical protein DWV06_17955 [Anaerosacchariphilus polymeriproducens]